MPDYQQGKIYKITSGDLTYIGSTTQTLEIRLTQHKSHFKRWKNGKGDFVGASFPLFEKEHTITLIEAYPCNSKKDLLSRERFYIQSMVCVNTNIPTRTTKEWCQDNAEVYKERRKQHYQDNHTTIREKQTLYREINRDKINARLRERRALKSVEYSIKERLG